MANGTIQVAVHALRVLHVRGPVPFDHRHDGAPLIDVIVTEAANASANLGL